MYFIPCTPKDGKATIDIPAGVPYETIYLTFEKVKEKMSLLTTEQKEKLLIEGADLNRAMSEKRKEYMQVVDDFDSNRNDVAKNIKAGIYMVSDYELRVNKSGEVEYRTPDEYDKL